MQIIIVQTEIEEAIKAHVLSQLSVKAGQKIEVELKATRGDVGMQAIINISNNPMTQVTQAAVQAPVAAQVPRVALAQRAQAEAVTTAPTPAAATKVITTADLKRMQEEEAALEAAQAEAEAVLGTAATTDAEAVEATGEEPVAEAPVAPANPPKRLFAGFSKPSNQTAA